MTATERYIHMTTGTSVVIRADTNKQVEITELLVTASAASNLLFTDSTDTARNKIIYLNAGINDLVKQAFNFSPGKDVTITMTGASASLFMRINQK